MFRCKGFTSLIGQTLTPNVDARGVPLTLNAVEAGAPRTDGEQFCLLLSGSADGALSDGIADVYHASFGTQSLFIERYGNGGGAAQYRVQLNLARAA